MFIVLMLLVLIKFQRWHAPWENDGAIKNATTILKRNTKKEQRPMVLMQNPYLI
jgi:hypothetical protein